jgi:hypothetical protein
MRQDCVRGPADCKSAIRQIANLRYVTELAPACNKFIIQKAKQLQPEPQNSENRMRVSLAAVRS